jgi:tyrosyl-tRNA synthetase
VTVAQMLTRDDFAKRYAAETPIFLHECLYPIMQAWDSVKIQADIELGGTEQLYSFMLARDLQRDQNLPQQIGVMSPILVGLDGVRRMGKSLGNYIGISEAPYEMMKKFMQLPDQCMKMYYELLTEVPLAEAEQQIANNPKDAKVALAKLVIADYHGSNAATEAANRWQNEIGGKSLPADLPEVSIPRSKANTLKLIELVFNELKLTDSSSDARRLIGQGGVWINDRENKITDINAIMTITDGMILAAGKKNIVRLRLTD